ncbi:radical SAM protein [Brachyspira intermedia]|uniref:radical SAM/SPASM domain-containing protein n=1 Tax=Brachyspira intermedia TaxID=84377 RepID=UPI003005C1A5
MNRQILYDKNSIIEINKDVIYVRGAVRGAIYNFNNNKIFSINEKACFLINKYIEDKYFNDKYLDILLDNGLISKEFNVREFKIDKLVHNLEFVWLEITSLCNLKCIHCYEGDSHKIEKNNLDIDDWKSILVQLKDVNCQNIEFIGGEPLMFKGFYDILDFSVKIGHNVHIYSNLTLFNNELINYIKNNNIVIHFSLYADNCDIHDNITQVKGSFDKTIFWLKELIKNNVKVVPAVVGMFQNQNNVDNIKYFLEELGIKNFKGYDIVRESKYRDTSNIMPNNDILKTVLISEPKFTINREKFIRSYTGNTCLFGKFSILPNGDVTPCEFERDIFYGNLKVENIDTILKSENLKKYWYLDFSKIYECKNCEYRFACKDCRPLAKINGEHSKNPRCRYFPLEGIWRTK